MVVAGVLRLGRYTRFVPHSVMIGFLTGVAVNIVLGQLARLHGCRGEGSVALDRGVGRAPAPGRIEPASLSPAARRSPCSRPRADPDRVVRVASSPSSVPSRGRPGAGGRQVRTSATSPAASRCRPCRPALLFTVTGHGRAGGRRDRARPGRGRRRVGAQPGRLTSDTNGDFIAQGIGNLASGLFRGQPVGGSVGQTALNVAAGARRDGRRSSRASGCSSSSSRSRVVGQVVMPTLRRVLIFAAVGRCAREIRMAICGPG